MKHLNGNKSKNVVPTTQATKDAILHELQNAKPTLKNSDYYTLYLGHKYLMPEQRTFMTLDFWIDFIGQDEAQEHLEIMTKTNEAFTTFAICEGAKKHTGISTTNLHTEASLNTTKLKK